MALELTIQSGRKGSNPGGLAYIQDTKQRFQAYLKYCPLSKIDPSYGFNPQNQPIYEAITFEMARRLGLQTPDFFVILNKEKDLTFNIPKEFEGIDPHRKCYFATKMITLPENRDVFKAETRIQKEEKTYLDILRIDDIIGRKQNYMFLDNPERIFYLDLGCSFVHAVNGYIGLQNAEKKVLGKSDRELKKALNILSRYELITNNNSDFINMADIANMPNELFIHTLNPRGRIALSDMISEFEISQISKIFALSMLENLKHFDPRLIECHPGHVIHS